MRCIEAMSNAVTLVRPGDVIAGRYRTERIIGEGAMGLVVEATDLELERQDSRRHPDLVERFVREALIAGELRSEHAVRVEEVGKLDCGQVYLVMELLEGEDLAAKLSREGRLEVAEALRISLQVAHALTAAHDAGIVHRDVKPANVFLCEGPDGRVTAKLLDFGLSKLQRAVQCAMPAASLTAPQVRLGTMPYMAPEQWLCSKDVDGRGDVWAVVELVSRCLAKSVTDRCASMRELVEVLEQLVAGAEARQQDGAASTTAAAALQMQSGRRASTTAMGWADTLPAPAPLVARGRTWLPLGASTLGGLFGSMFGEDLSLAPEALARLPSA